MLNGSNIEEKFWNKFKEMVLEDDDIDLFEIWIFYPLLNDLERILNIFQNENVPIFDFEIDGYPIDENNSSFGIKEVQKFLKAGQEGSYLDFKCKIVSHYHCSIHFAFYKKEQKMIIEIVFAGRENFQRSFSEEEHKRTLSRYIDFANKIRGNNSEIKCMFLSETTSSPEEMIDSENALVW